MDSWDFRQAEPLPAFVAFNYEADSRPNFVAPIYAATGMIEGRPVPKDAPPMFLAAASDDPLGLASDSVTLYNQWLTAKKPVEMHLYARGGHGFGMRKQNLPSDAWIDRFGEWLDMQGFLKKK